MLVYVIVDYAKYEPLQGSEVITYHIMLYVILNFTPLEPRQGVGARRPAGEPGGQRRFGAVVLNDHSNNNNNNGSNT